MPGPQRHRPPPERDDGVDSNDSTDCESDGQPLQRPAASLSTDAGQVSAQLLDEPHNVQPSGDVPPVGVVPLTEQNYAQPYGAAAEVDAQLSGQHNNVQPDRDADEADVQPLNDHDGALAVSNPPPHRLSGLHIIGESRMMRNHYIALGRENHLNLHGLDSMPTYTRDLKHCPCVCVGLDEDPMTVLRAGPLSCDCSRCTFVDDINVGVQFQFIRLVKGMREWDLISPTEASPRLVGVPNQWPPQIEDLENRLRDSTTVDEYVPSA